MRPITAVITLSWIGVMPEGVEAISAWIGAEAVLLATSLARIELGGSNQDPASRGCDEDHR